MVSTPDLGIPELAQSQANPDVTHNRALIAFQALLNGVIDKDLTAPPGSPTEGDAYLINTASPTGAWAGRAFCIAIYWGTSWYFVPGENDAGTPITMGSRQEGLTVYVRDENAFYVWRNTAASPSSYDWVSEGDGPFLTETDLPVSAVGALPFYEEGTWTPVLTFATPGDLAVTYTSQVGSYIRMGNFVLCSYSVTTSTFTHTTAAGALRVTGFPFTNNNANSAAAVGPLRWGGINKAGGFTDGKGLMPFGGTLANFNFAGQGIASANATAADVPTGGSVVLQGQVTFRR